MIILFLVSAVVIGGVGTFVYIDTRKRHVADRPAVPVPGVSEAKQGTEPIQATVKAKQAATEEENKEKGYLFEKYIVDLFDKKWFKIKEWRSDKRSHGGRFADSNKYPDMEVEFGEGFDSYRFAIECKWRSGFYNGGVRWAEPYQINNYLEFQEVTGMRVFVIIGIGGKPDAPEQVYVAPLDDVERFPVLFESYLQNYLRSYPKGKFFFNTSEHLLQ